MPLLMFWLGSAALAGAVAALAAVASYLINALAQVASALKSARPLSPFYLLFGNEPLQHGLRAGGTLAVLAVSLGSSSSRRHCLHTPRPGLTILAFDKGTVDPVPAPAMAGEARPLTPGHHDGALPSPAAGNVADWILIAPGK
jgi:hypothetical protein